MCHKWPKPSKVVVCQPSTEQKTKKKHYLQAIEKMSEFILQAVRQGGVARAEFSTDVTFSQWFCFLINACPSVRSLLCLFERNTACILQGNLGNLYAQNYV